jgi:TolA-binding protein
VGLALAAAAAVGVGILAIWLALDVGPTLQAAEQVAAPAPVRHEASAADPEPGVLALGCDATIALEEGARAWLVSDDGSAALAQLEHGRASIEVCPARPGCELVLETPRGSVVAADAVFTLEVASDAVLLTVEEGWAETLDEGGDGPTVTLSAGDELRLDDRVASAPPERATAAADAAELTIDALLKRARTHRQDRDFGLASQAYEQLIRAFPRSAAARNTLVALAQMELGSMQRPAAALTHFESYLSQAPSGTLAEEARVGRARALHRLGRAKALLRAADDYLSHHPAGRAAAEMLRRRGDAARQQGRCTAAASDYREVRRRWPGSPETGHAAKGLDACGSAL